MGYLKIFKSWKFSKEIHPAVANLKNFRLFSGADEPRISGDGDGRVTRDHGGLHERHSQLSLAQTVDRTLQKIRLPGFMMHSGI